MDRDEPIDSAANEAVEDLWLAERLRSQPFPSNPQSLELCVRAHLRRRQVQFRIRVGVSAMAVALAGMLCWNRWSDTAGQNPPIAQLSQGGRVAAIQAPEQLSSGELAVLFAPPPVSLLSVLDRQQELMFDRLSGTE